MLKSGSTENHTEEKRFGNIIINLNKIQVPKTKNQTKNKNVNKVTLYIFCKFASFSNTTNI